MLLIKQSADNSTIRAEQYEPVLLYMKQWIGNYAVCGIKHAVVLPFTFSALFVTGYV